jgi:DNA-3-methyladenine glycosylase II
MPFMVTLDVKTPFSFAQTLAFISSFPPCRDACLMGATSQGSLSSAVAIGGRAHAFTLREHAGGIVCEVDDRTSAATRQAIVTHASRLIGAEDDIAPLYEAAVGDAPFSELVRELHGLHHVRFPTLADSVVYSILMQRTPMTVAASYKRKFLAVLGHPITIDGQPLRVMPDLAELAALDESTIADAIGHRGKAARIATASRAVAEIGEDFLRTAPYEAARDALLEISGIGPFAAAAILLRGLGRMDELPWMPQFERAAEAIYGRLWGSAVGEATITRRYGRHIGYWSFYVMTGVGRRTRALH